MNKNRSFFHKNHAVCIIITFFFLNHPPRSHLFPPARIHRSPPSSLLPVSAFSLHRPSLPASAVSLHRPFRQHPLPLSTVPSRPCTTSSSLPLRSPLPSTPLQNTLPATSSFIPSGKVKRFSRNCHHFPLLPECTPLPEHPLGHILLSPLRESEAIFQELPSLSPTARMHTSSRSPSRSDSLSQLPNSQTEVPPFVGTCRERTYT